MNKKQFMILVLNTGSTSTKLAIYKDKEKMLGKEFAHTPEDMKRYPYMSDQLPMRQKLVEDFIKEHESYGPFDAIVSRGGILCPIQSGGYTINETMVDYLLDICEEEHASNVAACIAYEIAKKYGIEHTYIYDGITTDELEPVARISGIPDMPRVSITHALNMRATAIKAAEDMGRVYGELNLIVAHMGGGITMSFHRHGNAVDVVGDDEGPFAPERCGGQQSIQLMRYLLKKDGIKEKLKVMRGNSGLVAYFKTSDARKVEKLIDDGDPWALTVYEAMALQIAKSIAALSASAKGKVDGIILTGGLAYSERLVSMIRERISFIAEVKVYPGENEMEALGQGAYRILSGQEEAQEFAFQKEKVRN